MKTETSSANRKSYLVATAVLFLCSTFFFAPSVHAAIFYASGTISTANTWTANNIYVVQSSLTVGSGGTLTINSSTIVKLSKGAFLDVAASGTLKANGAPLGSATGTIYFTALDDDSVGGDTNGDGTSTTPHPGDSGYIESDPGSSSTLAYTIVRYGAPSSNYSALYQLGGNLTLSHVTVASSSYGIQTQGGILSISTSTISNNNPYGIYEYNSTGSIALTSSTFANNGNADAYLDFGSGLTFTPSGNNATGTASTGSGTHGFTVVTLAGNITNSRTWFKDLPYVLPGNNFFVDSGGTLTVNHGVVVKLNTKVAGLDILSGGTLHVQGTSTDRVYFTALDDDSVGGDTNADGTSTTPHAGDSGYIESDAGANSTIAYATIRYGGLFPGYSDFDQLGGTSLITNSQIASSSGYGVYAGGGTVTINSSEIPYDNPYGIFVASGTVSMINSSIHDDNSGDGVYNNLTVTSTAYAENNYWGDSRGPYNAHSNPNTSGTPVSDYVDYQNWLTSWSSSTDQTPSLANLKQYKSDATTTLAEGSSTTETTLVFGATLQSAGTSSLQLQVEVTTSTSFMNIANATSSSNIVSGKNATATIAYFPESSSNGSYHWQARVIDALGDVSPWQAYGSTTTSFKISTVPLYTQVTSTYPSLASTTSWANAPYDDALPGTGCGQSTSTISVCGCAITSAVEVLRSYGIVSSVSSTDVNPFNLNSWLASTTGGYDNEGNLNFDDVQFFAETPSGTFRVSYTESSKDHISSPSSTWVNKWLNNSIYATGTVPVILTVVASTTGNATTTHFLVATGFATSTGSTYTVRDPYFYNTAYLNQAAGTKIYNYSNTYQGAHVLEPTSTTILPLYLEYDIDSAHTLLVTDPNGNKLGTDSTTPGIFYSDIPNSGEDDDQPGSRFLSIYAPVAGRYTITVGGSGNYELYSYVADGKHVPIPQIISSSTPSTAAAIYHQNYDPANLAASTVQ